MLSVPRAATYRTAAGSPQAVGLGSLTPGGGQQRLVLCATTGPGAVWGSLPGMEALHIKRKFGT